MPTVKLNPDTIATSTNLTGVVTAIDEDPASPDADWLTATSTTAATDLRVTFPTPFGSLFAAQSFSLWLRKTAGIPSPTVNVSLYQGGTLRTALLTGTAITSTSGQLITANWDASDLVNVLDGSDVECRVEGAPGLGGAGALPAFSAAGTLFTSATMPQTNLALNSPVHAAGDLLIALVCCRNTQNDGTLTTVNGTGGTTGWTLENNSGSMYGGAQNARIAFGWKVATSASEVCSITTTGGTTTDRLLARVYRFTAANGFATPAVANIAVGSTGTLSTTQDMTMPTVASGGAANGLAVCLYGISVSSTQDIPLGETGSSWTEPIAENAGTNGTIGLFTADDSDAGGVSGGTSASGATNGVWVNVSLRLIPAQSVPVNTVEIGAIAWDAQTSSEPMPITGTVSAIGTESKLSLTIAPQEGTAPASGVAPTHTLALAPEPAAVSSSPTESVSFSSELALQAGAVTAPGAIPDPITIYTVTDTEAPGEVWGTGNAPTIITAAAPLLPQTGTITAPGAIPDPIVIYTVTDTDIAGEAWCIGNAPTLLAEAIPFLPQTGTITTPGNIPDPIVIYMADESGEGGIVWGTGNAPELTQTVTLEMLPERGMAEATGNTPGVLLQSVFVPLAGEVPAVGSVSALALGLGVPEGLTSAEGVSPTLVSGLIAQTGTGNAQGSAPNLTLQAETAPGTGVSALNGYAPAIAFVLGIQEGLASAEGQIPAGGVHSTLTPATGSVAANGNTPTLTSTLQLSPLAGETVALGGTPSLAFTALALPSLVTATGATPFLYVQVASAPIEGLVVTGGDSPAIVEQLLAQTGEASAQGDVSQLEFTFSFAAGAATAGGTAPSLVPQVVPLAGIAVASGNSSTLAQQIAISEGLAAAQGNPPASILTLQSPQGEARAVGNQPTIWLQAANSPITGLAAASGNVPQLSLALAPVLGVAATSGLAPTVGAGLVYTPQVGSVQASGNLPNRQSTLAPTPIAAIALGHVPSLTHAFIPAPDAIIQANGLFPALSLSLTPLSIRVDAVGNGPERFIGNLIFPETGFALAASPETSSLTLILELFGTTALRAVGDVGEIQVAVPSNRRETALTRLYSRLLLLTPYGILVTRNSTIPLAIPPAGAVVMLDSGPDTTDRGISEDFYNHRVRLELYIKRNNSLAKPMDELEEEVAAILAGDRTLGGVVDQMFLLPTSSLALAGGGTPIDINALSVSLTYGEPHAF